MTVVLALLLASLLFQAPRTRERPTEFSGLSADGIALLKTPH